MAIYRQSLQFIIINAKCIFSLMAVNEMGGGDLDQSLRMQLNEGEMSNLSGFIDPNETQLPTGILKFPVSEILKGFNEEIDQDLNIDTYEPHITIPCTPNDSIGKRLKEYENLMEELKNSTRQKVEAHHELINLKEQLKEHLRLHTNTKAQMEEVQREVSHYTAEVKDLQNEVRYWKTEANNTDEEQRQATFLKTKLAENNAILEELRIKHGQVKERLRESMKENLALKSSNVEKKDAEKGLEQLCTNYQDEIEELKRKLQDQITSKKEIACQYTEKLEKASHAYDVLKGIAKNLRTYLL